MVTTRVFGSDTLVVTVNDLAPAVSAGADTTVD